MDLNEMFEQMFNGESLSFDQFNDKLKELEKNGDVKLANLKTGEYTSTKKYKDREKDIENQKTQIANLEDQLKSVNSQLEEFQNMDIDAIKKAAKDWQDKYETDTKELQAQIEKNKIEYAARDYIGKFDFTSDLAKEAALSNFMKKGFKYEDGKFLGADDYMASMKEQNPAAFKSDEPDDGKGEEPAPFQNAVQSTMTSKTAKAVDDKAFHFNFAGVRPKPKE